MDLLECEDPGELNGVNSVLQWRGRHDTERSAFIFLADGERESAHLTYGELDRRARSVAAWLEERQLRGKPVVLLHGAGLEFITAFLGCLYAGAIAVPAYPPHPRRVDQRLLSILDDCAPAAALCSLADREQLVRGLRSRGLEIVANEELVYRSYDWRERQIEPDCLAHLQYTSGSTGNPKGVMVSHGNLLHQCIYARSFSECKTGSVHVSWQPFFHDMGLIGSVVAPAFCGALTVVMPPAAFLQSPIRWLRAITKYRGTGAAAPNFAYDLCVRGTTPAQREGLDLSTWEEAWNGAEPVRADTLDRFCETFEPYGFRRRTHLPCYGMAETTLCATARRRERLPVLTSFRRDRLDRGVAEPCAPSEPLATRLVSSGIQGGDTEVAIVDPETLQRRVDGNVGEIWVSGPSVARGYWKRPQESDSTFNARIAGGGERPYLRTGDLGFLREGELYVTGRLKDMIIIRGRNLYPQDIELAAQGSHDALQNDACAAFSVDLQDREGLGIAIEAKRAGRRRIDPDEVFEAIRAAIAEEFGVAVHWIGLLQPGRIPKTSSGKIMRYACRAQQVSGELQLMAEWRAKEGDLRAAGAPAADTDFLHRLRSVPLSQRSRFLVAHLQREIATALELRTVPDPRAGFERLGLDSVAAVAMVNRLQDALGSSVSLPATLLFDQPNIESVARFVEETLCNQPAQSPVMARVDRVPDEAVAVIGLGCRFPGAADADAFWRLLEEGREGIREVPAERWAIDDYFDPDPGVTGKMNTRFGGFIDEIEGFDAAFFDISPREATSMDPQHRHLLEVSWLALENAGIGPAGLDGRLIGVFAGISTSDYEQILSSRGVELADAFMATGNAHSAAVGRLAFVLGLQGPCVAVDTACSSSLVAVHQAVQSLRQGECEMALAGGVNAVLRPQVTIAFSRARLLSPDGRCKTFDAAADGYVRSEGCGVVVLKRLTDARRDGDRVLAVIRGSATNQDGRSSGLTAPNGPSQTRVIATALQAAQVDPASVQYLECHGSATVLGDPIEVQAANAILSRGRDNTAPLLIGSVKSNLGHLEAAAGIAGLIKVVLALQHGRLPRSLHFRTPNPHIPWASMPVKVVTETQPWEPAGSRRRIAGVSSFGFAGTNAHVVLEEAPRPEEDEAREPPLEDGGPFLLAISARTETALRELAGRYAALVGTRGDAELPDICHTANIGRSHLEHRAVVICQHHDTTVKSLEALARGKLAPGAFVGNTMREAHPRVAFLFPGQGLQYAGMARELYEHAPAFRESFDHCAAAYDLFGCEDGSPPLRTIMFDPAAEELLRQTRYVQPALYTLQVSLAALWGSWGVRPTVVLGHSAGEYAAAAVAGVFRLEDGLRLIVDRARLMQTLPAGGTMLSVTAPVETIEAAIASDEDVHVAAYNGLNTVISGPAARLDALADYFDSREIYVGKLPASNAFHCPSIEPILDDYEARARCVQYSAPHTALISTMTGRPVAQGEVPDSSYWRNQARRPVRFAQGIQALFEQAGCDVALELGPQAELIWLAQMSWRPEHKVLWTSSLAKGRNAFDQMMTAAGQLHVHGASLDFAAMETGRGPRKKVDVPVYPFQHERFWPGPMGGDDPSTLKDCFFELRWTSQGKIPEPHAGRRGQSWLVLADEPELGAALAEGLRGDGQGRVSARNLPRDDASCAALATILDETQGEAVLDHVVLVAGPVDTVEPDAMWNAQSHGVVRALLIAQALLAARRNTQLWLVTRGALAVRDGDVVDPTHAAIWGFGRTFALEHPDRCGGLIDAAGAGPIAAIAHELAGTLLCDDGEKQAAVRAGERWLLRLERYVMPAPVSPISISAQAAYLITGGTGALGLAVARHLAQRGAGQIVLTSRTGGDRATQDAMREIGAGRCRVDMIRADLGAREDVERLMADIEQLPGAKPLKGIIFAAGTHFGAPIVRQTPESLRGVLAPKISGVWHLHRICVERGLKLDLFVLCSSAASLFGSRDHANYTASNAYLDSFAHYRRSLGLPGLSINWGPWAGLGVAPQMRGESWDDIGIRLIHPGTAMRVFDRLVAGAAPQVTVQQMDLSRWAVLVRSGRIPPILVKLLQSLLSSPDVVPGTAPPASAPMRPAGLKGELTDRLTRLGPIDRGAALLELVREQVAAVLGIAPQRVDPDAGFFDLGMNSIMAVELRSALEARLGPLEELQAAVIFNHPTVQRLAAHLTRALVPTDSQLVVEKDAPAMPVAALDVDPARLPEALAAAAAEALGEEAWEPATGDSDNSAHLRKALAAILALRSDLQGLRSRAAEPIAIVGLSCRYPGAASPDAFWQLLEEGRDEISDVPIERWDASLYYDPDPDVPGKMNSRAGGFLAGIDTFDANFFGISPREARSLDPQHRLLLEVSWEALESANVPPRRLRNTRGGVFVGITAADYSKRVVSEGMESIDAYGGTGNALCAAAGRLAFTLGLQGPALAIDTACSSSLVAIHEACTSLRAGECDIALAGGVNLMLDPAVSITLAKAHALSPDDRCRTFDAAANGYVRSEGCGIVVLKRLSDATCNGDRILAVIRGSAVNQDGRSSGLTVPNGLAQEAVIRDALKFASVPPAAVRYLEAHGTGTPLGDPIEVQAANEVLAVGRDPGDPLLIGSVKSNIGHTEAAAGVASVIKVVLALRNERLPKTLHFLEPNPHVPWKRLNVKVAAEPTPWPAGNGRRIAGVSSFGFVGTNAHVVLEEAPAAPALEEPPAPTRNFHLLALSARSEDSLVQLARRYAVWLARRPDALLADLCSAANTGRDHFEHRAALTFCDRPALEAQLTALEARETARGLTRGRIASRGERRIAFLFTGQGSQSVGMGRDLYRIESVFRECFDRCAEEFGRLRPEAPDLRKLVFEDAGDGLIDQTGYTQPALYALEASLATLWRNWGVEPDVVLGHSVGEYAAAYIAGVFSLEDGMKLIAERGRLMQSLPEGGAMAAVSAAAGNVEEALRGHGDVCVGAYNGADTVISGARKEVDAVVERFQAVGVRCRRLVTSHAFHSARMEPMLEEFRRFAGGVSYRAPTKHMISNVSGDIVGEDRVLDAEYWTSHIREPVQFARGMQALQAHGCDVLLEIGPHPVLVGMGQPCWTAEKEPLWLGSLRREQPDAEQMLGAAASMYAAGVEIDFAAMYEPWKSSRRRVDLPFYPFQRQRFWVAASESAGKPAGARIQDCLYSITWAQRDPGPRPAHTSETWLILGDESGVTDTLRGQVEQSGRRCIVLPAGAAQVLADEIAAADGLAATPLTNVIHLWSVEQPRVQSAAQLWEAQARGVETTLNLVQVLIHRRWRGRLWLVTSGVQRVLDSDSPNPTHSPIWGLGKSIGMEHPELWGGLIDLPCDLSPAGLLTALESEDAEDQIALRDGRRWVARLESGAARSDAQPISVDAQATYLITGGLGGIGLQVANRLVQRGARHLVLNGRRAPSDSARQAIAALERLDCEVKVVLGDVSQEADVAALLDEIRDSRLPPLKGIIHAAGIDTLVRLHELDREQLRRTLAPKMAGAWLLDKLAAQRGIELTLFVCTSSISSVWGSVGQNAYSAANAFLDAFAEHRRAHGRPATTLNYGPWARIGMGTANEEGITWLRSRGIRPLDPAFALDGMEAAVAAERAATVFADVNWTIFRELAELQRQRPLFEKLGQPKTDEAAESSALQPSALIAQLTAAAPAERAEVLMQAAREELAKVLQRPIAELGNEVGFFDLGMDSLMAVEFRNALSQRLSRKLPATVVMDRPDIMALTTYVIEDILGLSLGKARPEGALDKATTDDTEAEVAAMSSREVDSALDEELKAVLRE